jgi:hypothetical protein
VRDLDGAETSVGDREAQEGPVGDASSFAHRLNVALRAMLRGVDLDPGLVQWIEAQTGATVVDARRNFGGGSRVTWFVDVERAGVAPRSCSGRSGQAPSRFGALARAKASCTGRCGTPRSAPRLLAATDDGQALLIERAPGTARPLATHRRRAWRTVPSSWMRSPVARSTSTGWP